MLGVKGGGCAGFAYDWQLMEEEPQDCETIDPDNGYKLYVDNMSIMYLFGLKQLIQRKMYLEQYLKYIILPQSLRGCGESINFDMDMVESNMDSSQHTGLMKFHWEKTKE